MQLKKLFNPLLLAGLFVSSTAIAQTQVIYNANGYTPLYQGGIPVSYTHLRAHET